MNDKQYRAFLNLMMCSDPWPASDEDHFELEHYAERKAADKGYKNWIEAHHYFPDKIPCDICKGQGGGNNDHCSNCQGKGFIV